jgi:hypothetical protein
MRELDRLCESYADLLRHLDPAAASAAGSVSGDGQLGRFDDASVREHMAALKATASAIEALEVEALADEIDRTALLDDLRATVARFEEDRPHRHDPGFWIEHLTQAVTSLLLRPVDPDALGHRARAGAERIAAIPAFLDTARSTLTRPLVILVDGALGRLGVIGQVLAYAASEFASDTPDGAEGLGVSVTAALQALTRFGHWLHSEVEPDAEVGGALGEARFDRRIHHRYAVSASASELWRYVTRMLDETEAALAAEARALDPAQNWPAQLARFGEETVSVAAAIDVEMERVRSVLHEHGVSVPPGPEPVVIAAPLRGTLSEAAYLPSSDPAGPARVVLPADRLSRVVLPPLAAATLAGRHLQQSAATRLDSGVRRTLRSPIAVHGWALYAEQWMAELDLFTGKGEQLARLARLLRAAGLLAADVGIHARGLVPSEALTLLTGRAGLGPDEARVAVRNILAHPTDAGAAAIGRREILALRDAAGVGAADRAELDRFHVALLGFGALPPGLAGWGMGLAS